MTDIRQKKENVKMHLKDLRQNLKKMHLEVSEELVLPKPDDVKKLMNKMDKLLIKILKAKKTYNEYIKNEKKSIIIFLFVITILAYFYPVIKHAKNKLDCETIAKNYIFKNKNTSGINNREIKMLSTNFCYGGEEIYEIENLKN